jgi:phosphatidate cytidylyltransferase
MQTVLGITGLGFLLGAAGITVITWKKEKKYVADQWLKYVFYMLIISSVLGAIVAGRLYFFIVSLLIVIRGFYEIMKVGSGKDQGAELKALVIYMLVAAGFLVFSVGAETGEAIMLYFIVYMFDGFCQLSGQLFGRRKLVPAISPNKTVEGLIGGFVATLASAYFLFSSMGYSPLLVLMVIPVCAAAFAGDLAASWYKRKMKVKDFSWVIPGHGGALDRFDSFIAAGAVYFLLKLTVGI